MTVSIGEPLFSDYSVHELHSTTDDDVEPGTPLAACIELLEAEVKYLTSSSDTKTISHYFMIEQISSNDNLVRFYTAFTSYHLLKNFFDFLGPSTYKLNYWGDSEPKTSRRRKCMMLNPLNQFFLMLVKLRLDLRVTDMAIRFGISSSLVSKYLIGLHQWNKYVLHYRVHFMRNTQQVFQLLMHPKYLFRLRQICLCSQVLGATTSITILEKC